MFSVSEMNFWFVEPEKWSRKKIGFNSIRMRTGLGRVHLLQRDKMRRKMQDNSFSWKNLDYKLSMSQQHSWCGNKGKHHTREYHPDNLWVILELCSQHWCHQGQFPIQPDSCLLGHCWVGASPTTGAEWELHLHGVTSVSAFAVPLGCVEFLLIFLLAAHEYVLLFL